MYQLLYYPRYSDFPRAFSTFPGAPTGTAPDLHVEIHLGSHRRRYCHARIDFSRKDLGLSLKCDLQKSSAPKGPAAAPINMKFVPTERAAAVGFTFQAEPFSSKYRSAEPPR